LAGAAPRALAAEAEAGVDVEAVIVTAAKREQNVQDVPISMNVTSQKQLERFNTADMKGLSMTVPSMVVLRTNSVNTITLRGFGSGPNNPATDQTVALYNDGVFAGRARQFMAPYFDVARIEILRGPQGALIGKNTAAGAISVVSNQPTRSFEGGATGSYLFDREGVDVYGYLSGPITDTLRARVAVKFINDNGWVRNTATGHKDPRQDFFNARGILTWDAAENVEVTAKFQYDDDRVDGRAMAGFPSNLTKDQAVKLVKTTSGLLGQTDHDYQKAYHGAITTTVGLGDLTLVSVTGYEEFKSDSWAAASHADPITFDTQFFEEFQQYSQELRLQSKAGGTFEWIVGGYLDSSRHGVDNSIRYLGRFLIFNLDGQMTSYFKQDSDTISAFVTGTWRFNDVARVIAGGRWTRIDRKGSYVLGRDFGQNFIGSAPVGPFRGDLKETHFDPSATVRREARHHDLRQLLGGFEGRDLPGREPVGHGRDLRAQAGGVQELRNRPEGPGDGLVDLQRRALPAGLQESADGPVRQRRASDQERRRGPLARGGNHLRSRLRAAQDRLLRRLQRREVHRLSRRGLHPGPAQRRLRQRRHAGERKGPHLRLRAQMVRPPAGHL
jgi:iron complex outermembrane receptor protein